MNEEFIHEYYGWWPSVSPLASLAEQYHKRCDEFDSGLCPLTGGMPTSDAELRMMGKNADEVFQSLMPEVIKLGFTSSEFRAEVTRWSHKRYR
jgi:hypothetical protein